MLSTKNILPAVDLRLYCAETVSVRFSRDWLSKVLLLPIVVGCFYSCRHATLSLGRWSAGASTSLSLLFLVTLPNTTVFGGSTASEQEHNLNTGEVDCRSSNSSRSSRRKSRRVNTTSGRPSSRDCDTSTAELEMGTWQKAPGRRLRATVEGSSPNETERRVQLQKKTSDEHRRQARLESEEKQKKQKFILKEMEDLLSDNSSWRKLQAKRQAAQALGKYADEEGQLDVESSDAWKEAYSKYKKQRKQKSALEIGAAASGAIGAAGVLGLLASGRQKKMYNPAESRAQRRSSRTMSAAGVLGLLGATAFLLGRRHLKKMQQLSERRLTRMENEAYAGVLPKLKPTLGVDELSEEEKRRRDREKQRQQRQNG